MKFFPRIDFLRKIGNLDAEISVIDKNMTEAAEIADVGERFLRYNVIASKANNLSIKGAMKAAVVGLAGLVGGAIMFIGGLCSLNLPLAAGGAALLYGTLAVGRELGWNADHAASACRDRCMEARDALIRNTPPKDFAASSQFDEIMQYPSLRRPFLLAAAREKLLPPAAPHTTPAAAGLNL